MGKVRGMDEAEQRGEYFSLEDTCKAPVVSAQTISEIVGQVRGDATLAARKKGAGKGWREQGALGQCWKWSELQGLLFICSIARESLRDV